MPDADERTAFWDRNILRWEAARYSLLSSFNPFAWTVRRRMEAARRLVREDFADHPDVLDLGCGSGILAHALIDREGRSYLGIDISGVAVAAARRRFPAPAVTVADRSPSFITPISPQMLPGPCSTIFSGRW